ncbi:MAG: hypothetical protein GY805_25005 [Chloroflexi bacterium]|nr:hypothetical protein [Chloroflexota bacterium]
MSAGTRNIRQRWIIEGTLELLTPTHLSNGDDDPSVDLPLLTDPLDGRPLLTGASIAGALRNYVNEHQDDYEDQEDKRSGDWLSLEKESSRAQRLFGAIRRDDDGDQSPLIVEDALGQSPELQIELRDGVRIDPKTRTAADKAKFDLELLAAGTKFNLGFELVITGKMENSLADIEKTLALTLHGLQTGQIALGGRKRRGYGECQVTDWRIWQYDLKTAVGLQEWLGHGRAWTNNPVQARTGNDILTLLSNDLPEDRRNLFQVKADFDIDGSVLIRSGFESDFGPDMAHLESRRNGEMVPILSGTSLAGVMRAQAQRIARTMNKDEVQATKFVRGLFGYMPEDNEKDQYEKKASRVSVKETVITGGRKLVQSRVAIDRFTGGALESALFDEQPLFGGQTTLTFSIKNPDQAEVGLLLLVLKDLWTGFVPVGGEASVGRGRLKGRSAVLSHKEKTWQLAEDGTLEQGDPVALQNYVTAFTTAMKEEALA